MKTKEIIDRANLANGFNKKNQEVFFQTLLSELKEAYANFGVKDSEQHFNAAVKILRSKWDGISKKIPYGLSDGVWGFFYARYVGPLKEEMCPTWKEHNDEWIKKRDLKKQKKNGTGTHDTDVD